MSLIPPDSPMRTLPTSLSRSDIFYLDGIRYCFEMFELVSLRLVKTLHLIGSRGDASDPIAPQIVEAITDSWSLIDVTHRLRELLQQAPLLKKKEPQLQLFIRSTQAVEELRNYFQHFRNEIHAYATHGTPLWGSLSWIFGGDESELPSNHTVIPGTFFADCRSYGCAFNTKEGRFIERIVLHAGAKKIDLAILYEAVEKFFGFYATWFEATYTAPDRYGSDVHLQIKLKPVSAPNTV